MKKTLAMLLLCALLCNLSEGALAMGAGQQAAVTDTLIGGPDEILRQMFPDRAGLKSDLTFCVLTGKNRADFPENQVCMAAVSNTENRTVSMQGAIGRLNAEGFRTENPEMRYEAVLEQGDRFLVETLSEEDFPLSAKSHEVVLTADRTTERADECAAALFEGIFDRRGVYVARLVDKELGDMEDNQVVMLCCACSEQSGSMYDGFLCRRSSAGNYHVTLLSPDYYARISAGDRFAVRRYTWEEETAPILTTEEEPRREKLNIVCFGNSFMLDTLSYLPPLLEEAIPGVNLHLGMAFQSNSSLATHLDMLRTGTPYIFYTEWSTDEQQYLSLYTSETAEDILARRDWDIVILHQTAKADEQQDFASLDGFARAVQARLRRPFSFLIDIAHGQSPGVLAEEEGALWENSNRQFAAYSNYARTAFETTPYIMGVLPTGTAVQNLRSAAAAQMLGDAGWLSLDGDHLQYGLGMLCASYAACYKLLEFTGHTPKTFAYRFTPGDDTNAALGLTYQGGETVGITPENMLLAQQCAVMALKNPYVPTDCSALR